MSDRSKQVDDRTHRRKTRPYPISSAESLWPRKHFGRTRGRVCITEPVGGQNGDSEERHVYLDSAASGENQRAWSKRREATGSCHASLRTHRCALASLLASGRSSRER